MQTQEEEELQSRLYFFKLGELKETAQDTVGLPVEAGLSADQLCFVFSPDDSKTTLEGSRTFSVEADSFNFD